MSVSVVNSRKSRCREDLAESEEEDKSLSEGKGSHEVQSDDECPFLHFRQFGSIDNPQMTVEKTI